MGGLVSGISDLFGGAQNNAGFGATSASILQPTNLGQTTAATQAAQNQFGIGQNALSQQQALANALAAQNGIQNQSNVYNQLQGVASGAGPNPAQAELAQATGQNVANQAALMAGQRGAGSNVGLLARQAAQQGANTQQQTANQAATLQANQSLNALNSLGGLANQQVAQQQQAVSGLNSNAQNLTGQAQSEQQALLNAIQGQNSAQIQNQSNLNSTNQAMAGINANNTTKGIGGLLGGIGSGGFGFAEGGKVENPKLQTVPKSDRYSDILYPSHLKDIGTLYHGNNFKMGGTVSGKAEVKGDSQKNDTVPAMLSPGEFVIPKSVMESKDPATNAAKMIADSLRKNGKGGADMKQDFKSALMRAMQERKGK